MADGGGAPASALRCCKPRTTRAHGPRDVNTASYGKHQADPAVDRLVGDKQISTPWQIWRPLGGNRGAARTRWFYRTLEERLRALPGVRAASIASDLPLAYWPGENAVDKRLKWGLAGSTAPRGSSSVSRTDSRSGTRCGTCRAGRVQPPAALNSAHIAYRFWSCAGGIVKSLPQCGRTLKGASSRSIIGSTLRTDGQSCFQVKWIARLGRL